MPQADEEKEFDPTPQKLLEARKKGEVAKSTDLNTAAAYLGLMTCAAFFLEGIIRNLGEVFVLVTELSTNAHVISNAPGSNVVLRELAYQSIVILIPLFIVPAAFTVASIIAQRSFTIAPEKVHPKLDRISPINGFKNKFGRVGIFEFIKSAAKLMLFIGVLAIFLWSNFHNIAATSQLAPSFALMNISRLMNIFFILIFALTLSVGLMDFTFQKAENLRRNKMSRKDLMDEIKNAEGDPLLKQRRRQKALAVASGQMTQVSNASVVMVNPTHYAVALRWSPATDSAPIIVAKGMDVVAQHIRALATEAGVPIHSDPPATRALFAVAEIGDPVPPDLYEAVAVAIRFAEDLRHKRQKTYG